MRSRWKELLLIVCFAAITGLLFRQYLLFHRVPFPANLLVSYYQPWKSYPYPEYPNGPPNKPMGFDNLRIHYPLKTLAVSLLKQGLPPLWNPHNFSGNTLLATYQIGIFHPVSWLFLLLPMIEAWSVSVLLQPFLGLLFTYLLFRVLKYSRVAATFGAVTFALSGTLLVWWEEAYVAGYTAIGLPLLLYALERYREQGGRFSLVLLMLGFVWLIVSGWFQFTLYALIFVCIWCWYRTAVLKLFDKRLLQTVGLAAIAAVALSGMHLLPAAEAYLHSARASTDARFLFEGYLMPLTHLVTLLAPDFFGNPATYSFFGKGFYYEHVMYFGIVPLFFVLIAIFSVSRRDKRAIPAYLFLVFLSLGLALPTSWLLLYMLKLPIVSVLIPSRIFYLSTFMASLLAADGLQRFAANPDRMLLRRPIKVVLGSLAALWVFVLFCRFAYPLLPFGSVSLRNLVLPTGFAVATVVILTAGLQPRFRRIVPWLIVGLAVVGSIYMANKYLYFSEARFMYPDTPVITELKQRAGTDRIWGYGSGVLENNFATQYGLYAAEGYDSFFIRRYGQLVHAAANNGGASAAIPRADARITAARMGNQWQLHPMQERLLALAGVRYVYGLLPSHEETATLSGLVHKQQVWSDQRYQIFRNDDALPRVFFADTYRVAGTDQGILTAVLSPETDIRRTLILEQDPGLPAVDARQYTATMTAYTPLRVMVRTVSAAPALLFLSDAYYPGWKAYVDGTAAPVYRADYAFRSTVVPAGEHTVEWRYEPESWKYGKLLSLVGLLVFLGLVWRNPGSSRLQKSRRDRVSG